MTWRRPPIFGWRHNQQRPVLTRSVAFVPEAPPVDLGVDDEVRLLLEPFADDPDSVLSALRRDEAVLHEEIARLNAWLAHYQTRVPFRP